VSHVVAEDVVENCVGESVGERGVLGERSEKRSAVIPFRKSLARFSRLFTRNCEPYAVPPYFTLTCERIGASA
jgi:hypothetical protein